MIPGKKKTPEEIAALREELGVHAPPVGTALVPEMPAPPKKPPAPPQAPKVKGERVVHLNSTSPTTVPASIQSHSLRRHDPPLAPASPSTQKTHLPKHRNDPRDIAQIRKREALAQLQVPGADPAAHIRKQIASPFLYAPGYLLAIAAAVVAFKGAHHITPMVLLALALAITLYIAIRKPRSRHHAALIFILIFLTAAFGGLHYAPLFKHGP